MRKRLLSILLIVTLAFLMGVTASAKTAESAKADNIFFYATDAEGKAVLLKVIPLDELKKLAHGQEDGSNYYLSATDNYPATQYTEARGITVTELVDYVKSVTTVADAGKISFSGGDTLRMMATDSYGNYNRSWTYNELYGVERYYFEGLFDTQKGWKPGWEIAGGDDSKYGISLDEYNTKYRASDYYYDNFKWVYNLKLDMINPAGIKSLGTVAEPVADVTVSGGTMTITLSCETPGAAIYYSFDGAPQIPYTKPLPISIDGRNLSSDPVTFYMNAVKEGWDDAGVITSKYPGLSPSFKTLYNNPAGQSVVFTAADAITSDNWKAWTDKLQYVTMKEPGSGGYVTLEDGKWYVDNTEKTLTIDGSLFKEVGSYSFVFHASSYADKSVSLTIKKTALTITPPKTAKTNMPLVFIFDDGGYQSGLMLYVTPPGGSSTMISTSWLDRTVSGRATLKAGYFSSAGSVISEPGRYIFSFVNSSYEPAIIEVELDISVWNAPALEDVESGDWYYDAVRYALGAGLFDTLTSSSFGASEPMTRVMLAEALYRLQGSPPVNGASPFTDCSATSVSWAYAAGIVNGMGNGIFAPNASITRAQAAQILFNYQ